MTPPDEGSRDRPVRRLYQVPGSRPDPSDEVSWEIEHHLAEVSDRLIAQGWDRREARREAERRFGEIDRHRPALERSERRRVRMRTWGEGLSIVTEALVSTGRMFRRSPGFACAVVATLALGIGANAALFGVVDRLLLRPPLHVQDAERVVLFGLQRPPTTRIPGAAGRISRTLPYPDYADWTETPVFEEVAAYDRALYTLGSGADAVRVTATLVSPDFFRLLGVNPVYGRFFGDDEDGVDVSPTVVLSEELWERAFGRDASVLGRTLDISGVRATVVGVAPEGFTGVELERVDLWMPIVATRVALAVAQARELDDATAFMDQRQSYWMAAVGRIADGVTRSVAEEEATRLHRVARADLVERGYYDEGVRIALLPLAGGAAGTRSETRVVRWLAGVSLLVLLIACANVANLLLAKAARERREVAVRLALGVSRARLVGERIVATIVLALIGGAVAVAAALWSREVIQRTTLPDVYFPSDGLSARVVGFALAVSCAAGLLAGVVPGLQASRGSLVTELRDGTRGNSARSRLRQGLAVAQAALSVVLLVGAGLFVKSLANADGVDLGFDADRLMLATLDFEPSVQSREEFNALYGSAAEDAMRIPGVEAAAVTTAPWGWSWAVSFRVPGLDSLPRMPGGGPYVWAVGGDYFETVGIRVVRGRGIEPTDRAGTQRVAVVSESMADSIWDGAAIGACVMVGQDAQECTTVVGVAEDAARGGLRDEPFFAYYLPYDQFESMEAQGLYVRTSDPEGTAPRLAEALRALSPEVRYASVRPLREVLDPLSRSWKLGATMFSALGLLALAVAAVGLYSLLAFNVAERRRELGIRSALGADRGRLLRRVMVEATRLTVWGVALGLAMTFVAAPYTRELLFEVSPRDPAILAGVALTLIAVAGCASLIPARRATRANPVEALRAE